MRWFSKFVKVMNLNLCTTLNLNKHCICGSQGITCPLYFLGRHLLVFLDFHYKEGRRRSPTCSQNLTKEKKINQTSRHAQVTVTFNSDIFADDIETAVIAIKE